ncbi:MAG: hypothetical protein IJV83_02635 [Clostridia bacterium]|nr:hypothetical protein [Clostridia bacterium]
MRKFLILLLSVCSVFALVGCNKDTDESSSSILENSSEIESSSELENSSGAEIGENGEVTEEEWNKALFFEEKQMSYTISLGEMWEKYTFDDGIIQISAADSERYKSFEDGKYYDYEEVEKGVWTKRVIAQGVYNAYYEDLYDLGEMYVYDEFTFNAEKSLYEAATVSATAAVRNITVKFEGKKVAAISYENSGNVYEIIYDYTKVDLELPQNATLLVYTQIDSEEEWNAAFAAVDCYSTETRTVLFTIENINTEQVSATWEVRITENTIYNDSPYYESVLECVNGDIYTYTKMEGESWEKELRTDRTWEQLVYSHTSMGGHGDYIKAPESFFDAVYIGEGDYYAYQTEDGLYWAYFEDGKLMKIEFSANGNEEMLYVFTFDYSIPTIEIPQI